MEEKRRNHLVIVISIILISMCSYLVLATCSSGGDTDPNTVPSLKITVEYPDGDTDTLEGPNSCTGSYTGETRCGSGVEDAWRATPDCDISWSDTDTICDDSGLEGYYEYEMYDDEGSCDSDLSNGEYVYWDTRETWCERSACGKGEWSASYKCCSPRTMDYYPNPWPTGTSSASLGYSNSDCGASGGTTLKCYFSKDPEYESVSNDAEWLDSSASGTGVAGEVVYMGCEDLDTTTKEDGHEYLANGNSGWKQCGTTFWTQEVTADSVTHEFICVTSVSPQEYSIAECNHDGSDVDLYDQHNYPGGMYGRGGQSVNSSTGAVYFCTEENKWSIDLDDYDKVESKGKYCNSAKFPPSSYSSDSISGSSMEYWGVGTQWTGSLCCGETDDWENDYPDVSFNTGNEYYNDDDRDASFESTNYPGGCFNNWYQQNETEYLTIYNEDENSRQLPEVLIWHGIFQGCAINHVGKIPSGITCPVSRTDDTNKPYQGSMDGVQLDKYGFTGNGNDFLSGLTDSHTGEVLINDSDYCTIFNFTDGSSYFCSYNETWVEQTNEKRSHLSFIPWVNTSLKQAECCQETQCWNGTECIDSVLDTLDPSPNKIMNARGDGFICKDGDWEWAYEKTNWDGSEEGYCIENTQCYVSDGGTYSLNQVSSPISYELDQIGNVNEPKCINDSEFYLDSYCENGTWTSRTKFVALGLYNMVKSKNDYILYCDSYDKVLNKFDYMLSGEFSTVGDMYFEIDATSKCLTYGAVTVPCANHVCVLIVEPQGNNPEVYMGTSINYRLNTSYETNDLGDALGDTLVGCTSLEISETDQFISCGGTSNEIYFNGARSLVIFSRSSLTGNVNYLNVLGTLFSNFLDTLISWLTVNVTYNYNLLDVLADELYNGPSSYDIPNFECDLNGGCHGATASTRTVPSNVCGEHGNPRKIFDLNTLFLSRSGTKTIFGFAEYEADSTLIPTRWNGLMFEGFSDNVCEAFTSEVSNYLCQKQSGKYIIYVKPSNPAISQSYETLLDKASWEQWVYMAPSLRIQD